MDVTKSIPVNNLRFAFNASHSAYGHSVFLIHRRCVTVSSHRKEIRILCPLCAFHGFFEKPFLFLSIAVHILVIKKRQFGEQDWNMVIGS